MKTLNMRHPEKPYPACPFCLTEVSNLPQKSKAQAHSEKRASKETAERKTDKPQSCRQHYGFLSEKENKQQIPEECLVCNVLLDCMLQRVRPTEDNE